MNKGFESFLQSEHIYGQQAHAKMCFNHHKSLGKFESEQWDTTSYYYNGYNKKERQVQGLVKIGRNCTHTTGLVGL